MRLGFSTLGDPGLTLEEARVLCQKEGFDFIELRALENQIDLPRCLHGRILEDSGEGGEIRVLASSLQLATADFAEVEAFGESVELDLRLHVPYIRVFGAGSPNEVPGERDFDRAARNVGALRKVGADAGWGGDSCGNPRAFCEFAILREGEREAGASCLGPLGQPSYVAAGARRGGRDLEPDRPLGASHSFQRQRGGWREQDRVPLRSSRPRGFPSPSSAVWAWAKVFFLGSPADFRRAFSVAGGFGGM